MTPRRSGSRRTRIEESEMRLIDHVVAGEAGGGGGRSGDVFDPNSGEVQATVALGTAADLDRAVAAAQRAQPGWAATNPQRRARKHRRPRIRNPRQRGIPNSLQQLPTPTHHASPKILPRPTHLRHLPRRLRPRRLRTERDHKRHHRPRTPLPPHFPSGMRGHLFAGQQFSVSDVQEHGSTQGLLPEGDYQRDGETRAYGPQDPAESFGRGRRCGGGGGAGGGGSEGKCAL